MREIQVFRFGGKHVSTGNQHRGLRAIYFVTHGNICEYVSLFGYFYDVIKYPRFFFIYSVDIFQSSCPRQMQIDASIARICKRKRNEM